MNHDVFFCGPLSVAATMQGTRQPDSVALLARYESSLAEIASRNATVCTTAANVTVATRRAASRFDTARAGWNALMAELQRVPTMHTAMRDLADRVKATCARMDALERRLLDMSVAGAEVREGRWRQEQLRQAEKLHAQKQADAAEAGRRVLAQGEVERKRAHALKLRADAKAVADEKQARAQADAEARTREADVQRALTAQYEAQRREYLAGESSITCHVASNVQCPSDRPGRLADVTPVGVGGEAELDEFYGSDDECP